MPRTYWRRVTTSIATRHRWVTLIRSRDCFKNQITCMWVKDVAKVDCSVPAANDYDFSNNAKGVNRAYWVIEHGRSSSEMWIRVQYCYSEWAQRITIGVVRRDTCRRHLGARVWQGGAEFEQVSHIFREGCKKSEKMTAIWAIHEVSGIQKSNSWVPRIGGIPTAVGITLLAGSILTWFVSMTLSRRANSGETWPMGVVAMDAELRLRTCRES